MNERIKELMLEANKNITRGKPFQPALEEFSEKFAQLIAQECAALAMTQHHSTSPADYDNMGPYEQGCDDTASAISGLIRRTFGVE